MGNAILRRGSSESLDSPVRSMKAEAIADSQLASALGKPSDVGRMDSRQRSCRGKPQHAQHVSTLSFPSRAVPLGNEYGSIRTFSIAAVS